MVKIGACLESGICPASIDVGGMLRVRDIHRGIFIGACLESGIFTETRKAPHAKGCPASIDLGRSS